MKPLVVTVSEPETGASWDYVFEEPPVVLGRGEGSQLRIDRAFVSLQHGTFDFDDGGITYVDLDSRNGTLIDGVARASDRPVPVTEGTDIRVGRLRLRVSRTLPGPVGADAKDPFAPKAKGVAKGTDALPREELERIRREVMEGKKAPAPVVAPPVVAPRIDLPPPPREVSPPATPSLDKTVPVPELKSRDLPVATPPQPASPYVAGGTRAVPAGVRPTPRRMERRDSRPRPVVERAKRVAPPPPRRASVWLPVALGLVVVGAAAAMLVVRDGERDRAAEEAPDAEERAIIDSAPPPRAALDAAVAVDAARAAPPPEPLTPTVIPNPRPPPRPNPPLHRSVDAGRPKAPPILP